MTSDILLLFILSLITLSFLFETWLDILNAKYFSQPIPEALSDVYDQEAYTKSQAYKKEKFRFGLLQSILSFIVIFLLFALGGFGELDAYVRGAFDDEVWVTLIFFGVLLLASSVLQLPFSYYATFVIEEKYGFNKSTKATFFLDTIKSLLLSVTLGGLIMWALLSLYAYFGADFWWTAWIFITIIMLLLNLFYTKLFVPLFNKQYPLEEGSLRDKIEAYAKKVGFDLPTIKVIDGSKRSTKANAYFSGFGKQKQITLYDTLINDLEEDEIVAVLAHEVGHYKRKHIIFNLTNSIATTGLMLWMLSLCLELPIFAEAVGASQPSFHIALLVFGVLYSPISHLLGIVSNVISRKFEYQADDYAKYTWNAKDLISSLKKLSKNSFSNLTPHPLYEWYYYSHPSLLKRVNNLNR